MVGPVNLQQEREDESVEQMGVELVNRKMKTDKTKSSAGNKVKKRNKKIVSLRKAAINPLK